MAEVTKERYRHPHLGAPLDGVRVLDLSQVISGPLCARALADMGADVIKVEAPTGDITRTVAPEVDGNGLYFTHANAGKRAITIDLRTADGAALIRSLALQCDVLLENFRPGVLARRGLGSNELLAEHPQLVYCSISGWGQSGPWADRRAYAPLVHAQTGYLEQAGRLRGEAPRQEVHVHGDTYTAFAALSAILGALFQRERTGFGQHLDVALADALIYSDEWASTDLAGFGPERAMDIWTHQVLPLANGADVTLVGSPVRLYDRWMAALGATPIPGVSPAAAEAHVAALVAQVADFATFEQLLEGEPMLVAELRTTAELAETDWAQHRELFVEVRPGARVANAAFRSDHADIGVKGPAPHQNQHRDEILTEVLGLSPAEIQALHTSGAIA